jgi:hypothetical protein
MTLCQAVFSRTVRVIGRTGRRRTIRRYHPIYEC